MNFKIGDKVKVNYTAYTYNRNQKEIDFDLTYQKDKPFEIFTIIGVNKKTTRYLLKIDKSDFRSWKLHSGSSEHYENVGYWDLTEKEVGVGVYYCYEKAIRLAGKTPCLRCQSL